MAEDKPKVSEPAAETATRHPLPEAERKGGQETPKDAPPIPAVSAPADPPPATPSKEGTADDG
jgi:hypothetical protein